MLGLNWMDFAVILLLVAGMLVGYAQGLLRQVIALAALYVGAIIGMHYFHYLADAFKNLLPTTPGLILNDAAFFLIMFAVMIILMFLGHDVLNVKLGLPSWVNHLCGMILGLLMSWLILTMAANILSFTTSMPWNMPAQDAQAWKQAEQIRQTLRDGLTGSLLIDYTKSTFPTILAAIAPWLPAGMPALFDL